MQDRREADTLRAFELFVWVAPERDRPVLRRMVDHIASLGSRYAEQCIRSHSYKEPLADLRSLVGCVYDIAVSFRAYDDVLEITCKTASQYWHNTVPVESNKKVVIALRKGVLDRIMVRYWKPNWDYTFSCIIDCYGTVQQIRLDDLSPQWREYADGWMIYSKSIVCRDYWMGALTVSALVDFLMQHEECHAMPCFDHLAPFVEGQAYGTPHQFRVAALKAAWMRLRMTSARIYSRVCYSLCSNMVMVVDCAILFISVFLALCFLRIFL